MSAAPRRPGGSVLPINHRSDRGSATGLALLMFLVVVLLAGTVADAGGAMGERVVALDTAQQAARAGANQLDLTALRRDGVIRLDPIAAQAAAQQFLQHADASGAVTATPTEVRVTVTRTRSTVLLAAIGVDTITVGASATAVPVSTGQGA